LATFKWQGPGWILSLVMPEQSWWLYRRYFSLLHSTHTGTCVSCSGTQLTPGHRLFTAF
jgi:hypothetical protein